jgi:hypothetical protein
MPNVRDRASFSFDGNLSHSSDNIVAAEVFFFLALRHNRIGNASALCLPDTANVVTVQSTQFPRRAREHEGAGYPSFFVCFTVVVHRRGVYYDKD